ncbi:MAG: hypothetical protein LBP34_05645 [Flavobacteriaceae bacterium]|jgi:hypothetical protein|nr:hypothetical protein [Flavobacteriaceae bacterium]
MLQKNFTLFFIFISVALFSQETPPSIEWGRVYYSFSSNLHGKVPIPGTDNYVVPDVSIIDERGNTLKSSPLNIWANSVKPTPDGGFIAITAVKADSFYAKVFFDDTYTGFGGRDAVLIKLDSSLEAEWTQNYGGSGDEGGYNVVPTSDGGYIFVGSTHSTDGQLSGIKKLGSAGSYYIVKTDSKGVMQWTKTYGENMAYYSHQWASQVIESAEGGYLIAGTIGSDNSGSDGVTNPLGSYDIWVLKLDASGNLQWQRSLGESSDESVIHTRQLADGNYIIVGNTESVDKNVSAFSGDITSWIVKLSATDGEIIWDRAMGELGQNNVFFTPYTYHQDVLDILPDGNLIVSAGICTSVNFSSYGAPQTILLTKINSETGTVIWHKTYGPLERETGNASPYSVTAKSDGSIIVFGEVSFGYHTGVEGAGADFDPSFTTFEPSFGGYYNSWIFKLSNKPL